MAVIVTPGSTAFLARTPKGPVLMVGDACHTAWGWKNAVPPGTFSEDIPKSRESLAKLQGFAERHPTSTAVSFLRPPFDLGFLHYASDTPYSKGMNLGSRNLSYFGMDPTYATSLAVARRIMQQEVGRLS